VGHTLHLTVIRHKIDFSLLIRWPPPIHLQMMPLSTSMDSASIPMPPQEVNVVALRRYASELA
jgi:hypothetical protein